MGSNPILPINNGGVVQLVSTQDFDSCNMGSSPVTLVWMLGVIGSTIVSKTISSGSSPLASAYSRIV